MPKNRKQSNKKWLFVAGLVVIAVIVGIYIHVKHENKANLINSTATKTVTGTTSKPTTHSVSASTDNSPGVSGGATDNNGQVNSSSLPPASDWVSSDSGDITLQQPSPNSTVKSGDTISGLAKVSTVQFTLTDNSVGLIAQDNLSVVNGKFSGTLQFTPHSSGGKLEVYYPNPSNGAEEDIVEINVNFSN